MEREKILFLLVLQANTSYIREIKVALEIFKTVHGNYILVTPGDSV